MKKVIERDGCNHKIAKLFINCLIKALIDHLQTFSVLKIDLKRIAKITRLIYISQKIQTISYQKFLYRIKITYQLKKANLKIL